MDNKLLTALEELYNYSKSVIDMNNITTITLITLMNKLIQIVEKYKELTGNQKKNLVIDTITKLINENISDDMEKLELLNFASILLPKIIDTMISAIYGEMSFTKDIKSNCFSNLFSCLLKPGNTKTKTNSKNKTKNVITI